MQVLVQSYKRLNYLKRTIESLRKCDVQIFVVDGGSDEETKEYIRNNADSYSFYENNPGADFLKNYGIKNLITDDVFIISADDIEYGDNYVQEFLMNYKTLNPSKIRWPFCSANMWHIENNQDVKTQWKYYHKMWYLQVSSPQSASAIVSRNVLLQVGMYPTFGKYGAGDWALGRKLAKAGYNCCYIKSPMVLHLGDNNKIDYPEFQQQADIDINENYKKAILWKEV